jgi:hypothetical protein
VSLAILLVPTVYKYDFILEPFFHKFVKKKREEEVGNTMILFAGVVGTKLSKLFDIRMHEFATLPQEIFFQKKNNVHKRLNKKMRTLLNFHEKKHTSRVEPS